ncbi:MAG: peptidylprolyl isomerase [Candidatus Pacearchaeota archaeon]
MALQKNDFIEIEFTGKNFEGDIFDSNVKEVLEKLNPNYNKNQARPFAFALGQGMFLKGVEDFLLEKGELGKIYKIELSPENAFGFRQSQLVQLMPMKIFIQQKINPIPGVMFNFDGRIGKILSVSGGRIMVDFNHPLAGKKIIYDIKVLRKIEDINEKTKSFIDFLFKRDLIFEIRNDDLFIKIENQMKQFIELFKDKFKEVLNLNLHVEEITKSEEDLRSITSEGQNKSQ